MSVTNVGSLTARDLTWLYTTELTPDRNLSSVKTVENALVEALTFSHIRGPILGRNHMNAMIVGKPSARVLPLLCIREYILERSHMNAVSVGEHSSGRTTSLSTRGFTLGKRPIDVTGVELPSARPLHL